MLCKKGVLRTFTKFTGKHLCQSPFFNKVEGLSYWIAFYKNGNKETYFHSFEVEYIPKEIRKFTENKNKLTKNIYRIQAYDSKMCG